MRIINEQLLEEIEHLLCMPYIKTNGKFFDLQIEELNSGYDIIEYMEDILAGRMAKDKYGNRVQLKSQKEKEEFRKEVKNNDFIYNQLTSKMNKPEKEMLDILLEK